ncbi:MAG: HAD family hydrolase [Haliea sp.]|jgi:FMN phosphatase YigB (HAD superfamily)|nr:HAD family hydrolase [Haliea sp.]
MKMIKAISLDFWGTIAVFNPQYSSARTRYLSDLFGVSEDEASARYKRVKRDFDHRAEQAGAAVTPLVAVKTLLGECPGNAASILRDIEQLVRDHPPLLHPEIPELLMRLNRAGYVVGVSSNTNFLAGKLIQSIFNLAWDFAVFSDELGVSKPDPDFFSTVVVQVNALSSRTIRPGNVIHIGDSAVCDLDGAMTAGLQGLLVNSPDETVFALKEIVGDIKTEDISLV